MTLFLIIAATFALGACVQTIAGFGSALVVMPILSQFIGIKPAVSVMVLVGATVTLTVLWQNREGLQWREASRLLAGSVVGVPLGVLALKLMPPAPVMAVLGVVLLAYGVYSFMALRAGSVAPEVRPPTAMPSPAQRVTAWLVGFCAGLLGGAYATDGPPLVVYGSIKKWPKQSFRSILQACFLVDGILMAVFHGAGGLVSREVLTYCAYGVPGMVGGLVIGSLLDRRINHALFHRLLLGLILVLGVALLGRAFMLAAAGARA